MNRLAIAFYRCGILVIGLTSISRIFVSAFSHHPHRHRRPARISSSLGSTRLSYNHLNDDDEEGNSDADDDNKMGDIIYFNDLYDVTAKEGRNLAQELERTIRRENIEKVPKVQHVNMSTYNFLRMIGDPSWGGNPPRDDGGSSMGRGVGGTCGPLRDIWGEHLEKMDEERREMLERLYILSSNSTELF